MGDLGLDGQTLLIQLSLYPPLGEGAGIGFGCCSLDGRTNLNICYSVERH